jgi:hypothetical protein
VAIFIPDGVPAHHSQERKENLEVMTRVEAAGAYAHVVDMAKKNPALVIPAKMG